MSRRFDAEQQYMDKGVWIRMIAEPAKEIAKLAQWQGKSDEALCTHTPYRPGEIPDYIAATYMRHEMPVELCDVPSNFGVLIQAKDRNIPFWQSGELQGVTKNLDYTQEKLAFTRQQLNANLEGGQFAGISETEIASNVEGADGVRRAMQLGGQRWNEGLFRYQADDVVGVVIKPGFDPSNNAEFDQFMEELDQCRDKDGSVPVFFYEQRTGKLWQVDDHVLDYIRATYERGEPKLELQEYGDFDQYEYPPYDPELDLELDGHSMSKQYDHIQRDNQSQVARESRGSESSVSAAPQLESRGGRGASSDTSIVANHQQTLWQRARVGEGSARRAPPEASVNLSAYQQRQQRLTATELPQAQSARP